MKVVTKDAEVVSEMTGDVSEFAPISEMITDTVKLDAFFPGLGLGEKAKHIAESSGDQNPEFAIVRVEEGWSNSKRLWPAEVLVSIAEQVNELEPVGHLGHIKPEDMATSFPDPQTTWIGAMTRDEPSRQSDRKGKQVKVAYFAGYNLSGAKIRDYIKSRAVRGISWSGLANQRVVPGKGVEVTRYQLTSLDWARKLVEGMPTTGIVAIASEMETVVEKTLAEVTPDEFKKENPNGYQLLVNQVNTETAELISEMETKVAEGDKAKSMITKICEALGIEESDDPLETIAALSKKVGIESKKVLDSVLEKVLAKKVPDEQNRALIKRLMPVSEMQTKIADAKDDDEAETFVNEMVEAVFNSDDGVKTLISEQSAPVLRRRELQGAGSQSNNYATRERVEL